MVLEEENMTENMKKYMDCIGADEKLLAELGEMQKLPPEKRAQAICDHAEKQGITLCREDLVAEQNAELSDDDLGNVSGGSAGAVAGILAALLASVIIFTPTTAYAAADPDGLKYDEKNISQMAL